MPKLIEGSILDAEADAIVNPANSFLSHGGGLARVIAQAATGPVGYDRSEPLASSIHGPQNIPWTAEGEAWRAEQRDHPLIPTGGIGVTSAGCLPYEGIIHAVGPIWGGGDYYEPTLLRLVANNAYAAAYQHRWRRLAVPAISCGVFGYPVEAAAYRLVMAARTWEAPALTCGLEVTFYVMGDEHRAAFEKALNA